MTHHSKDTKLTRPHFNAEKILPNKKKESSSKKIDIQNNTITEQEMHMNVFNETYLYNHPPSSQIIRGRVTREKNIFMNSYSYEFGDESIGYKIILKAIKNFSGYNVYNVFDQNIKHVAYVRKNFSGTKYSLKEMGIETFYVSYFAKLFENTGPRRLAAITYDPNDQYEKDLKSRIENKEWEKVIIYFNKIPEYNSSIDSFTLNFNGRVTEASVKNFQLIHPLALDDIILTFGRIQNDKFVLDYKEPLNMIQAFFFAITALDFKIGTD